MAALETYSADYYEDAHRNWFANPNYPLFNWIACRLPGNLRSILDAGCGKGAFLRYLRNKAKSPLRLVGIDYTENAPDDGIEYLQGEILDATSGKRFDAVVSLAVIEHVPNPVAFARVLASSMNPGGQLVVMTLDNNSLLYAIARAMAAVGITGPARRLYSPHHLHHFTGTSLRATLGKAGLKVVATHHHNVPLAAVDIPGSNTVVRAIYALGVAGIFTLGWMTGRTYLQTVIAVRSEDVELDNV